MAKGKKNDDQPFEKTSKTDPDPVTKPDEATAAEEKQELAGEALLNDLGWIKADDSRLYNAALPHLSIYPHNDRLVLNGNFNLAQLEAIVGWLKEKRGATG